ncbi:MAG: AtpZ/AtpI family protein [Alphaproteobacteria bacterium]|nr:AtpZ/AtpI family protein [Alphaproteobacteria bacterium]
MPDRPESDRLDNLADRIRQAETRHAPKPEPGRDEATQGAVSASRIGFDFVGAVAGAGFIGWLIDRQFGTAPWGVVTAVLAGFVLGFVNVWRALQSGEDKAGAGKDG